MTDPQREDSHAFRRVEDVKMETYRVDIRENRETDELIVEVYNGEDVITATERVSTGDASTREGDVPTTVSGEFTADTMVLDVQITDFDGGFEIRVVGDDGELFTERFSGEA